MPKNVLKTEKKCYASTNLEADGRLVEFMRFSSRF